MKKFLPAALIVIMMALIISCCFISCKKDSEDGSESSTETGTVENSSHLSPGETQESSTADGEDESDAPALKPIDTETEKPTEKETEKPIESESHETTESESETEAVTEEPKISLDYVTFGNGTCAVSGIGNCADVCVIIPERSPSGDIVTAVSEKAFYENTEIKAVQIPSTVTEIGNLAFGGCTSLVYISVDDNNRAFCDSDGILFSLDKTELIAYPAASGASKLDISSNVERIHDMAFYGCDSLEIINYAGTLAEWGKIKIGESNYGLYTASIYCSDYKK